MLPLIELGRWDGKDIEEKNISFTNPGLFELSGHIFKYIVLEEFGLKKSCKVLDL